MDSRPVLIMNRWSKVTASCSETSRMVRASASIACHRDSKSFLVLNDTGHGGHSALTPATGSFQA